MNLNKGIMKFIKYGKQYCEDVEECNGCVFNRYDKNAEEECILAMLKENLDDFNKDLRGERDGY
jgi:hypothetical protein